MARRRTDAAAAKAWWRAVLKRARGRCDVCNKQHPNLECHHAIQQQVIRREFPHGAMFSDGMWVAVDRFFVVNDSSGPFRSLQSLLWDPSLGMTVCPRCHGGHTSHMNKLPLDRVPTPAIRFAIEFGLEHRLGERFYRRPVAA